MQECGGVDRDLELCSREHEQLAPRLGQQEALVGEGKRDERWHVLHPLDVHEEQLGRSLADRLRVSVRRWRHWRGWWFGEG